MRSRRSLLGWQTGYQRGPEAAAEGEQALQR